MKYFVHSILTLKTLIKIILVFIFAIFFIATQATNTLATAQTASKEVSSTDELNATTELAKIKQEKLVIEVKSKEQEVACYKKFAVSSCLKDVKTEKLAALNEVKRRELEINNQLRSQKAKAVQEKQDKRESSKTSRKTKESSEVLKSGNSAQTTKAPIVRAEKLPADDKQRVDAASKRVTEANQKLAENQKKAQLRANKQSQSSSQAASHAKKLQQAEEHRNSAAQKQAAKTKPKSASLPIPSATEIAR